MEVFESMNLKAYMSRVGHSAALRSDYETLRALHRAHVAAIPFENVDVRLGRPIRLDPDALEEKLVARRRGGYCFEQNTLFAGVLREVGFSVETLEARVRPRGAVSALPRTHMTLKVDVEGRSWLADVGFGGEGPVQPVPLDGEVSEQQDGPYAVGRESGDVHVLRRRIDGEWADMYAFTLRPALPVDFDVASYYTSTFPASPFVTTLTAQRSVPGVRHILRGRTYLERADGEESVREIGSDEVADLLQDVFGLDVTEEEARTALGEE